MSQRLTTLTGDIAGDYARIEITVEDGGSPEPLTDATVSWALFEDQPKYADGPILDDTDGDVTVTIVDASAGRVDVELGTGATDGLSGTVHHRLRVTDSDGHRQTWLGKHELESADA